MTTMRRKSLSDGVFGIIPTELFMAALCSMGPAASSWSSVVSFTEGEAMQLAVYGAVLAIALGSVLLGTRLGIGAHVAHGRHQSGIQRRSATCAADAEHDDCGRADCAGHTGPRPAAPATPKPNVLGEWKLRGTT